MFHALSQKLGRAFCNLLAEQIPCRDPKPCEQPRGGKAQHHLRQDVRGCRCTRRCRGWLGFISFLLTPCDFFLGVCRWRISQPSSPPVVPGAAGSSLDPASLAALHGFTGSAALREMLNEAPPWFPDVCLLSFPRLPASVFMLLWKEQTWPCSLRLLTQMFAAGVGFVTRCTFTPPLYLFNSICCRGFLGCH